MAQTDAYKKEESAYKANKAKAARRGAAPIEEEPPKKKKVNGKVILVAVIVILLGLLFAGYYFNIFGTKDKVVGFFISQDGAYTQAMTELQTEKDAFQKSQEDLNKQLEDVNKRTADLDKREQEFKDVEKSVTTKQTAAGQGSITKVAAVYDGMNKTKAAEVLNDVEDIAWIAKVLTAMDVKKAAAVLGEMEPDKAAQVSQAMAS